VRIDFHRHNPCNPAIGYKVTEPIGAVETKYAIWLFLPFVDAVIWI
jgi:hypothetical protein